MRQRVLALAGVSLVFGGVFVAVGLGWVVLAIAVTVGVAGALALLGREIRRRGLEGLDLAHVLRRVSSQTARRRIVTLVTHAGTIAHEQGVVAVRRAYVLAQAVRPVGSPQTPDVSHEGTSEFYGWPYAGSDQGGITPPRKEPRLDDERRRALQLNARGAQLRRAGSPADAAALHIEALAIFESIDDRHAQAPTLNSLALALAATGDNEAAIERFEQSLQILREREADPEQGRVIANLGFTLLKQGAETRGRELLSEALGKLPPESPAAHQVEGLLRRAS